jgi:hypothetical protein
MFLVELKSGKEEVYRSLEDFTAAIRRGEVSARSRIYHRAASMWIPVTLHPHYRRIAAERPADPPLPLPRAQWTFLHGEPADEDAAGREAHEAQSDGDVTATKVTPARSWRSMFGGLIGHHGG